MPGITAALLVDTVRLLLCEVSRAISSAADSSDNLVSRNPNHIL